MLHTLNVELPLHRQSPHNRQHNFLHKFDNKDSLFVLLNDTVNYIANVLKNEDAALRLINDVEAAILKRLNNPVSFEPYRLSLVQILANIEAYRTYFP